jgi:DNA (cytosine-5)-methyltransferase 1
MTLIKEGNLNSSQDGNVFNTEGLSQSLSAGHGNVPKIIIPSNTKQGYEIAEEGDSVNLQQPNSTSPRGRVGHGIAQTLETQSSQIVIVGNLKGKDGHNVHNVVSDQGISPTVRSNHGSVQPVQVAQNPMRWSRTEKGKESRRKNQKEGKDNTPFNDGNRELIPSDDKVCGCVTSALNKDALIGVNNSNIRRLTEIECERLQGFPDNWTEYGNYNGIVKKIPKTQRYKLLGNAVTVKIVEEIGKRLRINYY